MAISSNKEQLEKGKFLESTSESGQVGIVVVNPDGSNVGGGGGAVTNAGTFAVQEDGAALTALQLIDNIVPTINGPGAPTIDSYNKVAINLNAGANQVLVSSAANKQIWVYGYQFIVNVAGTVSFQDEDDTALTGIMPFAANGGAAVSPSGNFAMPIWKLATDKDLEVDVVTSELDGWLSYAIVSV